VNMSTWFRIYRAETKCECLKLLRTPMYVASTLLFPLIFYVFFGLLMGSSMSVGSLPVARYILATYGAFGVVAATLFGLGVTLAVERGLGWLELKQASPMPTGAYSGGQGDRLPAAGRGWDCPAVPAGRPRWRRANASG